MGCDMRPKRQRIRHVHSLWRVEGIVPLEPVPEWMRREIEECLSKPNHDYISFRVRPRRDQIAVTWPIYVPISMVYRWRDFEKRRICDSDGRIHWVAVEMEL